MSPFIAPDLVEPVLGGLVGSVDVDGGPTDEQFAVLAAVTTHLWQRPDLDPTAVVRLGPDELAAAVPDDLTRRRFHELLFTIEQCRHPLTPTQVARSEAYAEALALDGPDLVMFRSLVEAGTAAAAADFQRFFSGMIPARAELGLRAMTLHPAEIDDELADRIDGWAGLPEGTLGWSYVQFLRSNGLLTPGREASDLNPLYVAHDMFHVITGIAPTGEGEIALGGFQVTMDDDDADTFAFLAPLIVHEAGFSGIDRITATAGTLGRPHAAELLGLEMARGAATTGNFYAIDHFELVAEPLADVRGEFGVRRPVDPADGHHVFWD